MLVVRDVEAGVVDVDRVGILHEELADAQEAGFGAWLVAELGLDLVPDLGQLLVAAQLAARDDGEDLLVGHAEAEIRALAILQAEHVVAHGGPAAGFLPDFARVQRWQQEFLSDGVHLLADDRDDLVDGAIAEIEVAVNSSAELADITSAQEQFVACDFGVCGSFTECGNKKFGPAVHAFLRCLPAPWDAGQCTSVHSIRLGAGSGMEWDVVCDAHGVCVASALFPQVSNIGRKRGNSNGHTVIG